MNRVITVLRVVIGQNDRGLPIQILANNTTTYAKARQITNSYVLEQMQVTFGEAWEFTVRYEPNREIQLNDVILYNLQQFTINGITRLGEGNLQWLKIRCSLSNHSGESNMIRTIKEIHVIGDVPIGGAEYSNWTGTIIAFRDGAQYRVKRDGSASGKEINYDSSTGVFTYASDTPPLEFDETTDIYFIVI